jgi:hypothetical protein
MKAVLIDPVASAVTSVELEDLDTIKKEIGFETIIADEIDGTTDKLYFDEDCFIRGTKGRFQLDSLPPVAGKAFVVGAVSDSAETDCELTVEELEGRIKFT